jgi:acyl carrier protein
VEIVRHELETVGLCLVSTQPLLETLVLETASQVFRQRVRREDSLFELAVDSLSVIEYCQRLEERLGVEVDIEELFAAESLASFSAVLETRVSLGKAE